MKTLDIEIQMMKIFDSTSNLIVPNISWGCYLHECDLLCLSKSGYTTEIEIKISRADLLNDTKKKHGHISNRIKYFYFAVPEKLKQIALESIPTRAGLYTVTENDGEFDCELVREALKNKLAVPWTLEEQFQLARLGALRILGLKKKIRKLTMKGDPRNGN